MDKLDHMRAMLKKHDTKMDALEKEIQTATGYRRQDLIREYGQMAKDRDEFITYARKEARRAR